MSVLVKEMILPPTCSKCPMCREDDLGVVYSYCTGKLRMIDGFGLNGIMDFCPLVEVPTPHGDLIDGGELYTELAKMHSFGELSAKKAIRIIERAKTVIEAEE